jgi:hypothetical protein
MITEWSPGLISNPFVILRFYGDALKVPSSLIVPNPLEEGKYAFLESKALQLPQIIHRIPKNHEQSLNPSHDILMMPNTDRYLEYVTAYFSV